MDQVLKFVSLIYREFDVSMLVHASGMPGLTQRSKPVLTLH
jgi:hypothetical protein